MYVYFAFADVFLIPSWRELVIKCVCKLWNHYGWQPPGQRDEAYGKISKIAVPQLATSSKRE